MREILNKYKFDVIYLLFLSVFFVLMFLAFSNAFGNVLYDYGREAILPEYILQGKVLYKDIFNNYGPFGYQVIAVLYKFFGVNLSVLRISGGIVSLIIVYSLYMISRLFTSRELSFVSCIFIIVTCVFNDRGNFIFPYSYSLLYSFCFFLFSVLFILYYMKFKNNKFLVSSCFFLGASLASKYEYAPLVLLMFCLILYANNKKSFSSKEIIYSIVSLSIVPILSYGFLFYQGLTFGEFLGAFKLVQNFSLTPSFKYFYSNFVGFYPSKVLFLKSFVYLFKVFFSTVACLIFAYIPLSFLSKVKCKFYKFLQFSWLILNFYLIKLWVSPTVFGVLEDPYQALSWVPMVVFLILIYLLFTLLKNKADSRQNLYLALVLLALVGACKDLFYLHMELFGTFTLPLLFVCLLIFVVEFLPCSFPKIDKRNLGLSLIVIILAFCSFSVKNFSRLIKDNYMLLQMPKGSIYTWEDTVYPTKMIMDYLDKNADKNDKVWVIPEGVMINFLTNNPTNGVYYNIIPSYMETFGEDKILADTKNNNIKYIVLNERDSSFYGPKILCKDYGFKLCQYIKSQYSVVENYGNWFKMTLYEKKY